MWKLDMVAYICNSDEVREAEKADHQLAGQPVYPVNEI